MDGSFSGALSWLSASAIFGSTPLLCFLAVRWLSSPSLMVAFKAGIATVLSLGYFLWKLCTVQADDRLELIYNLTSMKTFLHACVRGMVHVFIPFCLGGLGMVFLPPTMFGIAMVASVWLRWLLERMMCLKVPTQVTRIGILGLLLGTTGIGMSLMPIMYKSTRPCGNGTQPNTKAHFYNIDDITHVYPYQLSFPYVNCYSYKNILFGVLCFFCCSCSWAMAQIHWSYAKKRVHYTVMQFFKNLVAASVGLTIWAPLMSKGLLDKPTTEYMEGLFAAILLGIFTGWVGPQLVHYLSRRIDFPNANQYMAVIPIIAFLQDCLFVRDVITSSRWMIAIDTLGVLLVCAGIYLSHARREISNDALLTALMRESPHDYLKCQKASLLPERIEDANDGNDEVYHAFRYGETSPSFS